MRLFYSFAFTGHGHQSSPPLSVDRHHRAAHGSYVPL